MLFFELILGLIECCKCKKKVSKDDLMQHRAQLPPLMETLKFFYNHSGSIEFIRDKMVHKFQFPLPPYCFNLPEDEKVLFQAQADRSNPKAKVWNIFLKIKLGQLSIEDCQGIDPHGKVRANACKHFQEELCPRDAGQQYYSDQRCIISVRLRDKFLDSD
jgi:hypothetical protein